MSTILLPNWAKRTNTCEDVQENKLWVTIITGREHCCLGHCLLNYECVFSKTVFVSHLLEQRPYFHNRNYIKDVF